MAWLWLVLGGCFEVGFTTCRSSSTASAISPWTLGFLASVALSMGLLEVASRSIPMGTAYAVWAALARLTVIVGIAFFAEPSTTVRLLLILALVACIGGLRLTA